MDLSLLINKPNSMGSEAVIAWIETIKTTTVNQIWFSSMIVHNWDPV